MSPNKKIRQRGIKNLNRKQTKRYQPSFPDKETADVTMKRHLSSDSDTINQESPLQNRNRKNPKIERKVELTELKNICIDNKSMLKLLLEKEEDSGYLITDKELDYVQWDLELILSSVIERKNMVRDGLSSIKPNSQHYLKAFAARPKADAEVSLKNQFLETKAPRLGYSSKSLSLDEIAPKSKFWSQVEPYLAHPTTKDINWLKDTIDSYSSKEELHEVPPLGEHFLKYLPDEVSEILNNELSKFKSNKTAQGKIFHHSEPDENFLTSINPRVLLTLESEDTDEDMEKIGDNCDDGYVKKQLQKLKSKNKSLIDNADEVLDELMKCNASLAEFQKGNQIQLTELFNRCSIGNDEQNIKNKIKKTNDQILNFKKQPNKRLSKNEMHAEINLLIKKRSEYVNQIPEKFQLGKHLSLDSE